MRAFYFGCWLRSGHDLWDRGLGGTPVSWYDQGATRRRLLGVSANSLGGPTQGEIPWGYSLDGGLLRGKSLRQGEAVIEHRDGWTALSFWDYSVDSRPGSSSTFVFDEELEPEAALEAARESFPPVFARFTFAVSLSPSVGS